MLPKLQDCMVVESCCVQDFESMLAHFVATNACHCCNIRLFLIPTFCYRCLLRRCCHKVLLWHILQQTLHGSKSRSSSAPLSLHQSNRFTPLLPCSSILLPRLLPCCHRVPPLLPQHFSMPSSTLLQCVNRCLLHLLPVSTQLCSLITHSRLSHRGHSRSSTMLCLVQHSTA